MKKSRTEISLYKNQAIFFKKENFPPKFKTHLSELSGKKRQKKKIAKPAIETKPTEFESKCLDTIHRYLATPRVRSGQCFIWLFWRKMEDFCVFLNTTVAKLAQIHFAQACCNTTWLTQNSIVSRSSPIIGWNKGSIKSPRLSPLLPQHFPSHPFFSLTLWSLYNKGKNLNLITFPF